MNANPVQCDTLRDTSAAVERRLDCARLSVCLLFAAQMNWKGGMTCRYCGVRETEPKAMPKLRDGDGSGQ